MNNKDKDFGGIDEHRELLEDLAESDLPVAKYARRILDNLDDGTD